MTFGFIIKSVSLCAFYSVACLCLGAILLRLLGKYSTVVRETSPICQMVISFLLGSGILALVWCLLLSVSFFNPWVVGGILALSIIAGSVSLWELRRRIIEHLRLIWSDFLAETLLWKLVILLTVSMVGMTGFGGLAPLSLRSDATAFYLTLPKLFASTQRLSLLGGYEAFSTIGLHGEFHFAALMSLGSDWGAKLFTWPIGVACVVVLIALARKAGVGRRGQWIVMSMVFSSFAFTLLIKNARVDIFAAAMGITAFYLARQKGSGSDGVAKFLAGLFTGFAVVAKISYLPLIIPCIILFILWEHITISGGSVLKKNSLRSLTIKLFCLAIGMSLPFIIHLYKNWVLFHEPFAPFFYFKGNPFGGDWTDQKWFSPAIIRHIILTYPLALTFGRYPMQMGTMSNLILAFMPLALLLPRPKRLMKSLMFQLTVLGVLGIVIWVLVRPGVFAPRYILYTLLLIIPFVAYCTEYTTKNESRPRWLAAAIVIMCIGYLIYAHSEYGNRVSHNIKKSKTCRPLCQAAGKLNTIAEAGTRVCSLNYFSFWYRSDLLQCMSTTRDFKSFNPTSSREAWASIYDRGFQYVFIDQITHGNGIAKMLDPKQSPNWLEVKEIFNEQNHRQNYRIYKLTSHDPNRKMRITTTEIRPSVWKIVDAEEDKD